MIQPLSHYQAVLIAAKRLDAEQQDALVRDLLGTDISNAEIQIAIDKERLKWRTTYGIKTEDVQVRRTRVFAWCFCIVAAAIGLWLFVWWVGLRLGGK